MENENLENENFENVEIPTEKDLKREKRIKMCNEILKKERENLSKTVKDTDAEMARKLKAIIERFA